MARIEIFRRFKSPVLKRIGVDRADASFLRRVVANTTALIDNKLHHPQLRETHSVDGASRGGVTDLETDGIRLYADVQMTPEGKKRVRDREYRFVSAGFKTNFLLTGEPDGSMVAGPYLDHVAMLGADNPAVKGLVDLAEVQFEEDDGAGSVRAWIDDSQEGMIVIFQELEPEHRKPDEKEEETEMPEPTALEALEKKVEGLTANFSEVAKERDALKKANEEAAAKVAALEADNATLKTEKETATFAEQEANFSAETVKLSASRQMNAKQAEKAKAFAAKLIRGEATVAEFIEVLALAPKVGAEFSEKDLDGNPPAGTGDITVAMFSEAISDPKVSAKIMAVVDEHRKTDKAFTKEALFAEISASN